MDLALISGKFESYFPTAGEDLTVIIPAGSGISHIPRIAKPGDWKMGYVNSNRGRWSEAGEVAKYFGQFVQTCAYENWGGRPPDPDNTVVELWQTTQEIRAFNIDALPPELRDACYADTNPATKWDVPNLAVKMFRELCPQSSGVEPIYAPSASGLSMGYPSAVLAGAVVELQVQLLGTGTYTNIVDRGQSPILPSGATPLTYVPPAIIGLSYAR